MALLYKFYKGERKSYRFMEILFQKESWLCITTTSITYEVKWSFTCFQSTFKFVYYYSQMMRCCYWKVRVPYIQFRVKTLSTVSPLGMVDFYKEKRYDSVSTSFSIVSDIKIQEKHIHWYNHMASFPAKWDVITYNFFALGISIAGKSCENKKPSMRLHFKKP